MSFGEPLWFWALALLPVLVLLFFRNDRQRGRQLRQIVAARLEQRLVGGVSATRRRLRFAVFLLGFTAVVIALAQPRVGYTWQETKRTGRDVLIAIDTSRSMLATDLAPNRLTRAKLAAQDLIRQLEGDRVGLIAFAGTAFLQAPLTIDYAAVVGALNELDSEIIPRGGTNIAAAINTALEAFGKGESDHRALIIFTDGEELDADGVKAAEKQDRVMRIFTIGLGSADGSLIPIATDSGGTEFLKDPKGQYVKSRLDEDRLRKIAESTGGFYVAFQNGRSEIEAIARDGLGKMSEHNIDARLSRQPIERYQWPLSAGTLLLTLAMLISDRRKAVQPRRSPVPAATLLVLGAASVAFGKNDGVEAYERSDYKGAYEEFSKQLKRQPRSSELHFNLGAAAYKRGEFDAALLAFSKAVTSNEPQLRARAEYNLGNTLFQRGVKAKEKAAKLQEWRNALQHYDEALKVDPQHKDAAYNRDLLRKLIEELEKEPPPSEDKKDQQQQEQEKKEQEQKEQKQNDGKQQKKDQQEQGSDPQNSDKSDRGENDEQQKDEEGKGDQQDQKDAGGEKEKPDKNEGAGDQQKNGDSEQNPESQPEGEPAEKKEGDLKEAPQYGGERSEADQEEAAEAAAAAEGRMTEAQARSLLDSLKTEDDHVELLERDQKASGRVLRDW